MNADNPDPSRPCVAIRLGRLGDVILAAGVLEHWRRTRSLRFTFVTRDEWAPLVRNHPAVEAIIPVSHGDLGRWPAFCAQLARDHRGLTLIDLHRNLRSRILAMRWKGPVQGYPKFGLRRRLYRTLRPLGLTRILDELSVPRRYALALDRRPPEPADIAPLLVLDPEELAEADRLLAEAPGAGPCVALHPYATHADKAWPRRRWLELVRLLQRAGLRPVVVGRRDEPLEPDGALDLTNRTGLRQTAAVLARCRALATGDSGPMHLARAVNTPVVAMFGPTVRAWGFFPEGERDTVLERDLPCRPCSLHGARPCPRDRECLTDITPKAVLEAVQNIPDNDVPEAP
jgi:ADP-heptose:LPS heptosyltransferase